MLPTLLRRLAILPPLLLAIYTITFTLAWIAPGNPMDQPEGRQPPAEVAEAMKRQYRLDDPVAFYFDYLGKATGVSWVLGKAPRPFDLGPSLRRPDWSVNEILADALPVSVTLGAAAMLLAMVMGLTAGTLSGLRPRSWVDASGQVLAMIGISVPSFVIGAGLLIVFAAKLKWLPVGGWGSLSQLALPAIALSLPFAATIARMVRVGMIEQMHSDHARTARAKGLSRGQVARRHALKNAAVPIVTTIGLGIALLIGGVVVTESVFAIPGIGRLTIEAVTQRDYPVIQGVILIASCVYVLINLGIDVAYAFLDPRIRY